MLCIKVQDNEWDRKWTKHINVLYSVNWPNYLFITWVHYLSTDNMFSYKNINVQNYLFVMNFNSILKGQLISKANCQARTSSKKRTKDFCPGSLLLQG